MKRTELRRTSRLRSSRRRTDKKVVAALFERSGGVCEVCHSSRAVHPHHKLMTSHGRIDTLENLLHVCAWCHSMIHSKPALAYEQGWLKRGAA